MQSALKFTAPILPGRRIEISSPDLPKSGEVELIVVLPESEGHPPYIRLKTVLTIGGTIVIARGD